MVGAKFMMAILGRPETARALVFNKDLLLVPKGDGCITGVFAPVGAHATQRGPALRMKRGAMLRARSGRRTLLPRCSNTFQTTCPSRTHTCSCRQKRAHNWIPLFAFFEARAWRKPMGQVT